MLSDAIRRSKRLNRTNSTLTLILLTILISVFLTEISKILTVTDDLLEILRTGQDAPKNSDEPSESEEPSPRYDSTPTPNPHGRMVILRPSRK